MLEKRGQRSQGEQDFVLEAKLSAGEFVLRQEQKLVFQEIRPVRVLLDQGLSLKDVAIKLNWDFKSFESWYAANKKYFEL